MSNLLSDSVKELTDQLEQGIGDLFASGQYAEYLKTMAKFHDYSFNNCLLIFFQRPSASRVAGFGTWKELGRYVKRGEKGIKIFAPCPYKKTVEPDPTNQRASGPDGNPPTEKTEIIIPMFKVVTVFDVSQTDGKELPALGVDELKGDVDGYAAFFHALEQVSPVPVSFEKVNGSAKGYFSPKEQRIVVGEGMGQLQTIKTAVHEIAHATLHNHYGLKERDIPPEQRKDRHTCEVEAESVAFVVCQHYGIDTSDYSFGYGAGWCGRERKELKASLDTIRQTAADLIDRIDGQLGRERPSIGRASPERNARPAHSRKKNMEKER